MLDHRQNPGMSPGPSDEGIVKLDPSRLLLLSEFIRQNRCKGKTGLLLEVDFASSIKGFGAKT